MFSMFLQPKSDHLQGRKWSRIISQSLYMKDNQIGRYKVAK